MSTFLGDGWSLDINQPGEWIYTLHPYIDKKWRGTDPSGHEHSGAALKASTEARHSEPYWCPQCQDEHDDFLGYFCLACGVEVEPGTTTDPTWVPGPIEATLVISHGGVEETYVVSQAFTEAVRHTMTIDEIMALLEDRCFLVSRKVG